ncbi:hypothetical protein ACQ4M3_34660 [Leptolyngbya sp. AN03gr2]|uniref:hypothetical protein n=1 Tax=unclassified Leptolyngbya TaxID=2650499 RepID=UPI003D314F73
MRSTKSGFTALRVRPEIHFRAGECDERLLFKHPLRLMLCDRASVRLLFLLQNFNQIVETSLRNKTSKEAIE